MQNLVSQALSFLFLNLLDSDTRDIIFDAAESQILRKDRVEGRSMKRQLALGVLHTLRRLTDTPDDDVDQENPL